MQKKSLVYFSEDEEHSPCMKSRLSGCRGHENLSRGAYVWLCVPYVTELGCT